MGYCYGANVTWGFVTTSGKQDAGLIQCIKCDKVDCDNVSDYSEPTHPTVIVSKKGNFLWS